MARSIGARYVFGIHDDPGAPVRERLITAVDEYGYLLGDDGEIRLSDGAEIGVRWQLMAPEIFAERPWHLPKHPCPFVAPLAGSLVLEPVSSGLSEHRDLALGVLRAGHGAIACLDRDRGFQAVVLRAFDLGSAVRKHGIDDGDALLTRERGPYEVYVAEQIARAAAATGHGLGLGWVPTSIHNPHRLDEVRRPGIDAPLPAIWRLSGPGEIEDRLADATVLDGVTVEIWAFDLAALDDDAFWL